MRLFSKLFLFFTVLLALQTSGLQASFDGRHVTVELLSRSQAVSPGKTLWLGLRFQMEEDWHIYSPAPEQEQMIPQARWQLPEGFEAGDLLWPQAKHFQAAGLSSVGYSDEVLLPLQLSVPEDLAGLETITFVLDLRWIECKDECIPRQEQLTLSLPVGLSAPSRWEAQFAASIASARQSQAMPSSEAPGFVLALFLAFLGGLILNVMPCVLPVISLKVMKFVQLAGQARSKVVAHGLLFSLGVLSSFWLLAAALLLLQSGGHAVGWGFQLQDPRFVAAMLAVLFVLSLSLFGVFEFGLLLSAKAGQLESRSSGLASSFWNGILATLVATPCTGPLLGPVLGYAVTVSTLQSFAIFTAMGLGLSFPYLMFSVFPQATQSLPKPGAWMLTFRQVMGFLMMGSVIWLLWVFISQTDADAGLSLMGGLLLLAFACWIHGQQGRGRLARLASWLFALAALYLCFEASHESSSERLEREQWQIYSDARVAQLRAKGVPVFIDFTAKWCLICQANKVALHHAEVSQAFEARGIQRLRADWTKMDPEITAALGRYGRNGVPLYVLIPADSSSEPLILPQTLTPGLLLDAIDTLGSEP